MLGEIRSADWAGIVGGGEKQSSLGTILGVLTFVLTLILFME